MPQDWLGDTPLSPALLKPVARDPECWLSIPGFEGRYEASSLGRIRSLRFVNRMCDKARDEPLILKITVDAKGYQRVGLAGRSYAVHSLVLTTFKGPRPPGLFAAHRDGNRANNAAENLIWATAIENESHKDSHGTRNYGERLYNAKLSAEAVAQIRSCHVAGDKVYGARPLARRFGVSQRAIQGVIRGTTWVRAAAEDAVRRA